MSERVAAIREAATFIEDVRDEVYPRDVFIPPTKQQFAEINALLKRERGHQLDGVAAECYRRALTLATVELRRWADEIEEDGA